jgi:hypothetical protein
MDGSAFLIVICVGAYPKRNALIPNVLFVEVFVDGLI